MTTDTRVFVYYNLHKKLWSIKALDGAMKGKVIGHSEQVLLRDPVGKVSEAGRQRVLLEKRKNVHAGIVGYWAGTQADCYGQPHEVTYNPYKYKTFVFKETGEPFISARQAVLNKRQVFVF